MNKLSIIGFLVLSIGCASNQSINIAQKQVKLNETCSWVKVNEFDLPASNKCWIVEPKNGLAVLPKVMGNYLDDSCEINSGMYASVFYPDNTVEVFARAGYTGDSGVFLIEEDCKNIVSFYDDSKYNF